MRRYVLVRAAWQAGMLFAFVSLAYFVVWVLPTLAWRRDPGYGDFLRNLAHGSLGRSLDERAHRFGPSVDSIVWDASRVTLSLLLVTAVFAVSLGALFAFVAIRGPRWRQVVRAGSLVAVSLLPIWTGLYLSGYLGFRWGAVRTSGYCPLRATRGVDCHGLEPWLSSLILPALALAIFFAGIYARWLSAACREGAAEYRRELQEGHDALEARAGLRRRYGLAFAKLLARDFGFAIGFATFIEATFSLPGLGRTFFAALNGLDAPVMTGVLVAASVLAAGVSFLVDLACAAIDPRFRRF